ncbi:MAG: hypothetical protein R2941_04390 [Desulfobacterales bacterium]
MHRGSIPEPESCAFASEPIPIHVIYEDADIILIDKPQGFVVPSAPGHANGTLVARFFIIVRISGASRECVQALSTVWFKDTSGLWFLQKRCCNGPSCRAVSGQTVRKKYLAWFTVGWKKILGSYPFPSDVIR